MNGGFSIYFFVTFLIDSMNVSRSLFVLLFILPACCSCSQPSQLHADWWVTTGDEKKLLEKQDPIVAGNSDTNSMVIIIDTATRFQKVDGFGYTLTGGSAQIINAMEPTAKRELLQELFGQNGIRVSYLRISVGASD